MAMKKRGYVVPFHDHDPQNNNYLKTPAYTELCTFYGIPPVTGDEEEEEEEEVATQIPPAPSAKKNTAMASPSSARATPPPVMSGDAIGVAVQLLNAHRTHVDGVLECLRGEMEKLAEFEAHGDGSAHRVAEYASCIAESMHKREQMLEAMYQRLGALCASLAQAE